MDVNSTGGLLQLATVMSEDVLKAAKIQEMLGLQNNQALLTRLSTLQILLDEVYGISCPSSDDYASRWDLIRIFNDIAREIYGDNDACPVVENFGSFLMDMFSAKSDLDLSINFSDQLFETDRMAKRRTLRKFAKKFYALRGKGHVSTVELILSARVPVLKVTDSGSGIECDLSVGNRDGIAKSRIVFLISGIDQRFRQLSFMMKAWAKAHDINSSKDGTLNSLSLILLAAFHLQTRDIPILPPFSAIFKGGTDPAAVEKIIPTFLNFGKRNKESLAELFVSLLVKLESVETLWSRGLSASTYEGSWIRRNSKATGYMSIEDFTDRSQNTARAVKSAQMNKIYSCIHRSVELIRSFTEGIIDATQLKNLLFGLDPHTRTVIPYLNYSGSSKTVCSNPSKKKKKRPTQGGPVKGQRPGKQGKHGHNPCSMEAPGPCGIKGVNNKKSMSGKKLDPASSDTRSSFQGFENSQETPTPSLDQEKKNPPTQGGPTEGQLCGKKGLHSYIMDGPAPSSTEVVKKKKSKTGRKTDPASSDTPKGLDKLKETLTPNSSQKQKKHSMQGAPVEGQRRGKKSKKGLHSFSVDGPTPSKKSGGKKMKLRIQRKTNPVTSETPTSLQGFGKSQQTLNGSCQSHPVLPIHGSGGYRCQRADIEALNNGTPIFQVGRPYNNQSNVGSGVFRPQRTHVSNLNHVASSLPADRPSFSNPPIVRYVSQKMYADASGKAAPRFQEGHPAFISNSQVSGGFGPSTTHLETLRNVAPNLPLQEPLPFLGSGGFRSEITHVETMKHAIPSFPSNQPFSHSHLPHSQDYGGFRAERYHGETTNQPFPRSHQHSQDYGGFRSDRHHVDISNQPFSHSYDQRSQDYRGFRSQSHHVETSRHTPNFPSGLWVSDSNQTVHGSGRLLPRRHVETQNHPVSKCQSPYLANLAPGFGLERSHAVIMNHTNPLLQPASYTLGPRSSSFMPPHQPYIPSALHREPAGLQRSHDPRQAAPNIPSQYAANMHPYQS